MVSDIVPDIDEYDVINPGSQTQYKGTAYTVKQLKGEQESGGGPAAVLWRSCGAPAKLRL